MFLKVAWGKEVHLINRNVDMTELGQFIRDSFKGVPDTYGLTYLDSDGDLISLSSDDDLKTLYDSEKREFTKVQIAVGDGYLINDNPELEKTEENSPKLEEKEPKSQDLVKRNIDNQVSPPKNEDGEIVPMVEEKAEETNNGSHLAQQSEGHPLEQLTALKPHKAKEMIESQAPKCLPSLEKVEKKEEQARNAPPQPQPDIANLILQGFQSVIPSLINKVRHALSQNPPQSSKVIHPKTNCSQCSIFPIMGIRYNCLSCQDYNLCESCEAVVIHSHHLLKMRTNDQIEEQKRHSSPIQKQPQIFAEDRPSRSTLPTKPHPLQPSNMKLILKNVQNVLGESKEVEEFVQVNCKEGVDRILDMWFNRS